MAFDGYRNSHHSAGHHVAQFWPGSPINRAGRKVKQEIDNARCIGASE